MNKEKKVEYSYKQNVQLLIWKQIKVELLSNLLQF